MKSDPYLSWDRIGRWNENLAWHVTHICISIYRTGLILKTSLISVTPVELRRSVSINRQIACWIMSHVHGLRCISHCGYHSAPQHYFKWELVHFNALLHPCLCMLRYKCKMLLEILDWSTCFFFFHLLKDIGDLLSSLNLAVFSLLLLKDETFYILSVSLCTTRTKTYLQSGKSRLVIMEH